jgi:hypothetical protein
MNVAILRVAIGRWLLWFIEPAEAERDQPLRERSAARRVAYEQRLERQRPEIEAATAGFREAAKRVDQLADNRLSTRSAADNLV